MMFDPFENRLSRDVRNRVGSAFVEALKKNTPMHFFGALDALADISPPGEVSKYLSDRRKRFDPVYREMSKAGSDFYAGVRILWNSRLYFECHEWIEERWLVASGNEKKTLQGFLLASVAMEHHTYHRQAPFEKLARKAAGLICQNPSISALFCSNWDALCKGLLNTDPDAIDLTA